MTKKGLKNQIRNLHDLEEYGRSGRYREAFRAYLASQGFAAPTRRPTSTTDFRIRLQYAIALQHAGLFEIALKTYQQVAAEILTLRHLKEDDDFTAADIVYNARVQQAVLLERLGQPREALNILNEIGLPNRHGDARLAMASMQSWTDATRLKCALALRDSRTIRVISRRCIKEGDWNQKLWGRLFSELAPMVSVKTSKPTRMELVLPAVSGILAEMDKVDPSGTPWLSLIAGQEIARRSPRAAEQILRSGHQKAAALGKFYVIAALCEQLTACYSRLARPAESDRMLRRALAAYARCGLLMLEPFTRRLFRSASKLWGETYAADVFLRSAHLLEPREELVFSQMCAWHAEKNGRRPDEIFEDFVRDWAPYRYPGRYRHVEAGRETADALIVHRGKGTFVQAKHVAKPLKHIPKILYFRTLAEKYNVEVERYVLVISTSDRKGWQESLWHAQYTERVRQLVPDPRIIVEAVLEPELQTDVVLNDELFEKYFQEIHGPTGLHSRHRNSRA